jgi:thymidylate synthase (FAD)
MDIINASYKIETPLDYDYILKWLENKGRTAWKSESKIEDGSADKFISMLINKGHESVIEHFTISVRFICDRGISHELVRHRLVSITQESTRYVNYLKRGLTFIRTPFWDQAKIDDSKKIAEWLDAMKDAERHYANLIKLGATPEEARTVLAHSTKTELVITANIAEWRNILKKRTTRDNHPQMRELMIPLLQELQAKLPILFNDIIINHNKSLYKKRPVAVEAIQWFKQGDHPQVVPIPDKYHDFNPVIEGATGFINTLEGGFFVTSGDWVIKGVKGEYYPCKPDIFEETYERF